MTVSSDTLALLMQAGIAGEQLLAVVRSIESDNPPAPERQVGASAIRMRRMRERQAAGQAERVTDSVTSDVTCDGHSDAESDAAPFPDKSPPHPQKLTPTPGVCVALTREADPIEVPFVAQLAAAQLAIAVVVEGLAARIRKRWRGMPPPTGVAGAQWKGFLDHRRSLRKTLTDHAYVLLCRKLEKLAEDGWPPGTLIDLAVERGWLTVFPPRDERPPNGKRSHDDWKSRPCSDPHPGGRHCAAADDVFGGMEG